MVSQIRNSVLFLFRSLSRTFLRLLIRFNDDAEFWRSTEQFYARISIVNADEPTETEHVDERAAEKRPPDLKKSLARLTSKTKLQPLHRRKMSVIFFRVDIPVSSFCDYKSFCLSARSTVSVQFRKSQIV